MSHPLVWPKKVFFYPIGNTSAVCLTHNLAPEEPANLLLLGCGDPRNILYTIYSQSVTVPRKLDFTCCDVEAAVLARNVLLLSMLADNQISSDMQHIWNIFFHLYLDKASLSLLLNQCRVLIDLSESLSTWHKSKYAIFLKICSSHTLSELRRHWLLYVKTEEFAPARMQLFRKNFTSGLEAVQDMRFINGTACRSAGPLWIDVAKILPNQFQHYWKTGTTSINSKDIAAATFPNPTFAYSASGERFSVHYGTNPLISFHLAPVFAAGSPSITDLTDAAKAQFYGWCDAFKASISLGSSINTIIRLFAGDALAFSQALYYCAVNKSTEAPLHIAPWTALTINLDGEGYADGQAPMSFDVIDTSNLIDHVGLLNLLATTAPLLSTTPSSTLYTEALLISGENATDGFRSRVCGDIAVMALILGLVPTTYVSKFTSGSNTHEIMAQLMYEDAPQFHERVSWKNPSLGDTAAVRHNMDFHRRPIFNASDLGNFIFGIYIKMFHYENVGAMLQNVSLKAIQERSLIHYIRETFVMLLKLVKERVETDWESVMGLFLDLVEADRTLLTGSNHYQDLCGQLHLHGVYSVPFYRITIENVGRFQHWDLVPPVIRVILVVPREKLKVVEDMDVDKIGTPSLQCDVRGMVSHNVFSSIRVAFGTITSTGTKRHPTVEFEEDPAGWSGTSSLVVSFWMPSWSLTVEPQASIHICFSIRNTPTTVMTLVPKLGMYLNLFAVPSTDERSVYILPGCPDVGERLRKPVASSSNHKTSLDLQNELGRRGPVRVTMDVKPTSVSTMLTVRVDVENARAKSMLSGGETVKIEQISPGVMKISFESFNQELAFPFPVMGSHSKLRIARKSSYVEVSVPVLGSSILDGISFNPFSVVVKDRIVNPWSIHRVNLARLPILDTTRAMKLQWLDTHLGTTFSDRERALRDADVHTDVLMNLKDSLHTILIHASGVHGTKSPIFRLVEPSSNNTDTLIFITELRLDIACHTIVGSGYVLPLTDDIMPSILEVLGDILSGIVSVKTYGDEYRAWKQILPALTERCREWKHNNKCKYIMKGAVPLSETIEEDPLCGCGRGKDIDAFLKVKEWKRLAPYVVKIAIGPLFAVSYLDSVGGRFKSALAQNSSITSPRSPAVGSSASGNTFERCKKCGGNGKPKLLVCGKCRTVSYCSAACQKEDWRAHKPQCKNSSV